MSTVRFCPDCGEPIEIPDDEKIEPGHVVRHATGECPTMQRDQNYEYLGTFTVRRFKIDAQGNRVMDDGSIPLLPEDVEGTQLAMVADSMTATTFKEIGYELVSRVGTRIEEILKNATIIDTD